MNNSTQKALEYAREGMFVPKELTNQILDGLVIPLQASIMVLYSMEMLPVLHDRGYTDVTLVTSETKKYVKNLASKYGYKFATLQEAKTMNFNLTLGNPPFSENKGGTKDNTKQVPIYPDFFKKATELSDRVAMIMPITDEQPSKAMREHNELINTHLQLREECTEHFSILVNTHYVIWDKNKKAKESIKVDYDLPLPERQRIPKFIRGNNKYSVTKSEWAGTYVDRVSKNSIPVISRLRKEGPVIEYFEPSESNVKAKRLTGKWLLITLGTSNNSGTLAGHVLKNDEGYLPGANVLVWEFDTRKEAKRLQEWFLTDEFIDLSRGYVGSISKTRNLPHYE